MRLPAFVVPVLLLLVACGVEPGAAPDVERPRLSLAGDLPPADATVRIALAADGRIRVGDRAVDAAGLRAVLAGRAAAAPRDEALPWKASRLNVLLAADRRARVGDLIVVLGELTDPDVRMDRLFFEVAREDGSAGAFAWFRPQETCIGGGHGDDPPHVRYEVAAMPEDPEAFVERALRGLPPDRIPAVEMFVPEATTVEALLLAAAGCRRAGADVAVLSLPRGTAHRPGSAAPVAGGLAALRATGDPAFAGFPVEYVWRPEEAIVVDPGMRDDGEPEDLPFEESLGR